MQVKRWVRPLRAVSVDALALVMLACFCGLALTIAVFDGWPAAIAGGLCGGGFGLALGESYIRLSMTEHIVMAVLAMRRSMVYVGPDVPAGWVPIACSVCKRGGWVPPDAASDELVVCSACAGGSDDG